jgi:hypothetical protein
MAGPFTVSELAQQRMAKARKYLRFFLMDTEQLNRLIRGRELEDEHLEFAILMTISDWNTTTPVVGRYDIGNFPSLYLLMHGAAIQCLKMAGMYQSRNELTYNSGGSSFVRANKTPYYQSWISNFASEYEAKKLNYKIQKNVEGAYGRGFASEYDLIGYDW